MRIGFYLTDAFANTGIGRVTQVISGELAARHEVTVISHYRKGEAADLYPANVKLIFLHDGVTQVASGFAGTVKALRRIAKENKLDVLIGAGSTYFLPTVLSVMGTKTKSVCWEHHNATVTHVHRFQGQLRCLSSWLAARVVTLTDTDVKLYRKKFGCRKCVCIPNPVDRSLLGETRYDPASRRIISVGRLVKDKNFEDSIRVGEIFLKKHPDWSWDIYGKGEHEETLRRLIAEAGLTGRMNLAGHAADLYEKYDEYAALVMTSTHEGLPMTLLEGAARGIPALAFDIMTGPSEIIIEDETGYLFPFGDVEGMAAKLDELAKDDALRARLSAGSRAHIDRYAMEAVLARWEALLAELK